MSYFMKVYPEYSCFLLFVIFFNKLSIFMGIFVWCVKYFLPFWGRMHNFMFSWWLMVIFAHINCTVHGKVTIWGDVCLQMLCLLNSWVFFFFLVFTFCNYFVYFRVLMTCALCQAVRCHFLLLFDIPRIWSCPLLIFCF